MIQNCAANRQDLFASWATQSIASNIVHDLTELWLFWRNDKLEVGEMAAREEDSPDKIKSCLLAVRTFHKFTDSRRVHAVRRSLLVNLFGPCFTKVDDTFINRFSFDPQLEYCCGTSKRQSCCQRLESDTERQVGGTALLAKAAVQTSAASKRKYLVMSRIATPSTFIVHARAPMSVCVWRLTPSIRTQHQMTSLFERRRTGLTTELFLRRID